MRKNILTVMVGLSASGKSYYAEHVLKTENTVIVSMDEIWLRFTNGNMSDRKEKTKIIQTFLSEIKSNLQAGHDVIADSTNLTVKERKRALDCAINMDVKKCCQLVVKPYENCVRDNAKRNGEASVPSEVLLKQIQRFQIPFIEEGFDEINIYATEKSDCIDINKLANFDQKNSHHVFSLLQHSMLTSTNFMKTYNEDETLIVGALFHDYGKLFTQSFDENGEAHYKNHANIGAYYALCSYPTEDMLNALFLINYHMLPFEWGSEKCYETWRKRFGDKKTHMLKIFHACDM